MNKRPNIIYFVADQMRADSLSHLGNEASITPNFDQMAKEGISFAHAYCQNPVCVPSRCSFLTGLYPHTTGHRTIHYLQNDGEPNFLRTMKNQGYEVVWIGRNDIIPGDRTKEEFCDLYYRALEEGDQKSVPGPEFSAKKGEDHELWETEQVGYYSFYEGKITWGQDEEGLEFAKYDWGCIKHALSYVEEKSKSKNQKPFFLYVSLVYPHPEYMCEEPWFSSIDRKKVKQRRPSALSLEGKSSMLRNIAQKQNLQNWGDENFSELRATYLAMVSRLDYQYGLLIDKLKECGMYDDTSIFVFSDHGDYTGDYDVVEKAQNCFEDPVSNVPLLIKPAQNYAVVPRVSEALVELVDITATVEEMTGVKTEYVHFGKSLVHLLEKEEEHRDAVFCEGGRIHGETWAMELGHGKKSRFWPRLDTQASEGSEHTKAVMCRTEKYKYIYRLYESDELYDLENDPDELNNLAKEESFRDVIQTMKARTLDWFVETGDIVPDRKDVR